MAKIINKILKKLTPETIKVEMEIIKKKRLSPAIKKWVKRYEKLGERDRFIWMWLSRMLSIIQLPIISKKYRKSLLEIKLLIVMFLVQLDDVADKNQKQNLLKELLKIPLEQNYIHACHLNSRDKKYLLFTQKLWNYIIRKIKKYPRYKEFKEIFYYDVNQMLNAMRYSYILNTYPYLINKTESWLFISHNMGFFIYFDLDLMCAPNFNFKILGPMREIVWRIQKMARIGNWVSTWEREIGEKDFTSGVFAYAIDSGVIFVDELKEKKESEVIKKIKKAKIEDRLLKEWEQYYYEIKELSKKIKGFGASEILPRFEKLLVGHLISRGYK